MAKFVEITHNVKVTDGGETTLDRQLTFSAEIEEVIEGTIRVANGSTKFICIPGSEGAEVSPMALGVSAIRGYLMNSDVQVEIHEDGATAGVSRGPGAFGHDNATIESIKILNNSGLPANIKFFIWGDR